MRLCAAMCVLLLGCGGGAKRTRAPAEFDVDVQTEAEPESVQVSELTLPRHTAKVGDVLEIHADFRMTMRVQVAPGQSMQVVREEYDETITEVLGVDDRGVVVHAKITYAIVDARQTMAGDIPAARAGKSYLVWRNAGKLQIARADGGTMTPPEIDEVAQDNRTFGEPDPEDEVIASKTWKLGEPVVFTDDELARMTAGANASFGPGTSITASTMTLRKVKGDIAHFDLTTTIWASSDKGHLRAVLTGTMQINRRTGLSVDTTLTGPADGNMGAPMRGRIDMRTYTP